MNKENRTSYKIIAVLTLMMALWSCKDDINKTGYDLLLPGDLISAHKVTMEKSNIKSFTVKDQLLSTNKPGYNLLGSFADSVMGLTTADFACQFRILEVPQFKAGEEIDSMVVLIGYRSFYGDTITPIRINAYELTSDLNDSENAIYLQDENLKAMTNGQLVGSTIHYPTHRDSLHNEADTTSTVRDTITVNIRIKLNEELKKRLAELTLWALDADTIAPIEPNIPFLEKFKGLYIEAEPVNVTDGGAIMRAFPYAIAAYTHKWKKTPTDTIKNNDSIIEVVTSRLDVTNNSARVNRFEHYGYSNTTFATHLDQEVVEDTLIYLQTTGGLSNKIYIPDLDHWADSTGVTINKAQLIFTVEPKFTDTIPTVKLPEPSDDPIIYTAPPKLILGLIGDNGVMYVDSGVGKGGLIYPADLTFSESYFGGTYDQKAGTYTFNLAAHLQKIIKRVPLDVNGNVTKNNGFYLTTDKKNSIFNRVVLKGARSTTGIRFEVTYTKIQ